MVNNYFDLASFYAYLSGLWSALPLGFQLFTYATFGMFMIFGIFRMLR